MNRADTLVAADQNAARLRRHFRVVERKLFWRSRPLHQPQYRHGLSPLGSADPIQYVSIRQVSPRCHDVSCSWAVLPNQRAGRALECGPSAESNVLAACDVTLYSQRACRLLSARTFGLRHDLCGLRLSVHVTRYLDEWADRNHVQTSSASSPCGSVWEKGKSRYELPCHGTCQPPNMR